MRRKTKFMISFFFIALAYVFPLAGAIIGGNIWMFTAISLGFLFSVSVVYWITIKKKKPKYPAVPPEGLPDIYTMARIPRPIYEDMERYPWLFGKKRKKSTRWTKKKVKKKKH